MAEAKSKTLLVLNRNYVLTTTKGHSVAFEKGKPTHVPPAVYQDALALGAIPPDGEDPQVEEVTKTDNAPADPAERAPLILAAIEEFPQLHCSWQPHRGCCVRSRWLQGAGEGDRHRVAAVPRQSGCRQGRRVIEA